MERKFTGRIVGTAAALVVAAFGYISIYACTNFGGWIGLELSAVDTLPCRAVTFVGWYSGEVLFWFGLLFDGDGVWTLVIHPLYVLAYVALGFTAGCLFDVIRALPLEKRRTVLRYICVFVLIVVAVIIVQVARFAAKSQEFSDAYWMGVQAAVQNAPERCGEIEDDLLRQGCYAHAGGRNGRLEFCEDAYVREPAEKDHCFAMAAQHRGDATLCGKVVDAAPESADTRDQCYYNVAEKIRDPGVCALIVGDTTRGHCLEHISGTANDIVTGEHEAATSSEGADRSNVNSEHAEPPAALVEERAAGRVSTVHATIVEVLRRGDKRTIRYDVLTRNPNFYPGHYEGPNDGVDREHFYIDQSNVLRTSEVAPRVSFTHCGSPSGSAREEIDGLEEAITEERAHPTWMFGIVRRLTVEDGIIIAIDEVCVP